MPFYNPVKNERNYNENSDTQTVTETDNRFQLCCTI